MATCLCEDPDLMPSAQPDRIYTCRKCSLPVDRVWSILHMQERLVELELDAAHMDHLLDEFKDLIK